MKACIFVWGFIAFSILGFTLLEETETFITQDFESNFIIVNHPEEFLPNWSANEVRDGSARVFQASGEGVKGSKALGIQTIGTFDAQIYIKTSTIGLKNNRISFQAKTAKNGTGNRPVGVYYSFSENSPENFGEMQPIGTPENFPNEDTPYREYYFEMPESLLDKDVVYIRLDVLYGAGSGTAARLFLDDFILFGDSDIEDSGDPGIGKEDPEEEDPEIEDPIQERDSLKIEQTEKYGDKGLLIFFGRNDLTEVFDIKNIHLNHGYGEAVSWLLTDSLLLVEFGDYLFPNHYELAIEYSEKSEESPEMLLVDNLEWISPIPSGAIIINEFMADPNPKGLVPPDPVLPTATNDEYIELYNRTDKPILLSGFTYNGGTVGPVTLEGGGYLLLVPASKTEIFSQWGTPVGVSPFRALPNNSGQILIADTFGVIDSLSYDTSWYLDNDKSRGGWSLERVDPYPTCQGSFNWKASVSEQGGTPGLRNSVYEIGHPDLSILEIKVLEGDHVEIRFSGNMDPAYQESIQILLGGNAVLPEEITSQRILFRSPVPMTSGSSYLLEIKNLKGCHDGSLRDFSYALELAGEEDPDSDPENPIEKRRDLSISRVEKHGETGMAVHFDQLISDIDFKSIMLSSGYGSTEKWEIRDSVLVLDFGEYLYSNRFELTLRFTEEGIVDSDEESLVHSFDWHSPTPFGAIIINEFMADPNPKGLVPPDPVLPTASTDEYIELYNRTDKPIRLAGFTYNGGTVADLTLEAGGFALLCPASKVGVFGEWGPAVGVSPFRALPNASGGIVLSDAFGIVDSLSYDTSWYHDSQKSQGGWSLERINPYVSCTDRYNWKASVSSQGGTPGAVNSVFSEEPDPRPFIIREVRLNDENQIEVLFSKIPDSKSRDSIKVYFEGTLAELQSMDTEMLTLTNPLELVSEESYLLEITGVWDCYGLGLDERYYTFTYDTEPPVLIGISALAEDEFKLYFDEPLDLFLHADQFGIVPYEGQITNLQAFDSQTIKMALDPPLELGQAYQFYARNILDLSGNRTDETALEFYLDDQLDTLVFAGPAHLQVYYKIPVDSMAAVRLSAYRLDRKPVHPERVFQDATNPLRFHLLFREELPANTPVELRVEGIKDVGGDPINTLKKPFLWDTRNIAIADLEIPNDSTLLLSFNKSMDEKHALIHQNYTVNKGIGNPVKIHFKAPNAVALQFREKFENGLDYQLSLRNLRDVYGVEMPRTINRAFVYDVIPPKVNSGWLVSPFEIRIDFDKPVMFPEKMAVGDLGQLEWKMDGEKSILVKSHTAILEDEVMIKFSELHDLMGNTAYDLEYKLDNSLPQLGHAYIWDAQHLVLSFSHFLDPSLSIFPDRYLVNHQAVEHVLLQESGFELKLEFSDGLQLGDSVVVEVLEIKNKNGSSNHKLKASLRYDDGITAIWPENSQMIQIYHGTALQAEGALLGPFKLADDTQNIEVIQNHSNPAHLKLVLENPLLEGQVYQMQVPPRLSENQKIHSGSIRSVEWDTHPPKLVEVEAITENELLLHFDEPLDPILAVITGFYEINGTHPVEVLPLSNPNQVLLVFEQSFHVGMKYELKIQHIEDRYGNSVSEMVWSFIMDEIAYPYFRDIVINEVMAAPRSGQALPNVEYVEIYNASDRAYNLGGYLLANSRSTTVFPRETIDPKEHIILCPINQVENFRPYGRVIGLNHWPTLLNDGDEVNISDRRGALIDRFVYNTGSYGSSAIAQAGYSLELVNPYHPCLSDQNIRPSQDAKRGTPGKRNSVFDNGPDRVKPQLIGVEVKSPDMLSLFFSKPLAHIDIPGILLAPWLNVSEVYQDSSDLSQVLVVLAENLKDNQAYVLQVSGWKDCVGNALDPTASRSEFKIPGKAEEGDIILNEVLFNPRTGGPKFVEIYNQSAKYLNLKNWKLANFANDEISNRRVISGQDLILKPFGYMVFTTDADRLLEHYPKGKTENFHQMSSLPSYPIISGTVILLDPEEQWAERLDYHEKMHHSFLRDFKGISLERYGVHAEVNDPNNWHSASSDAGYATPGYKNSQTYGEKQTQETIVVDPPVFVPDAPGERPFTTIHYQLEKPGYMASIRIFSSTGIFLKGICENELWGEKGFYTWNGTNEKGVKVPPGYYILLVELVHPDGSVRQVKKTMVVGAKF